MAARPGRFRAGAGNGLCPSARRVFLLWVFLLTVLSASVAAQTPRLSLQDILRMIQDDEPESVIATQIQRNNRSFNLNEQERQLLRDAGATEAIIALLLDPAREYTPATQPERRVVDESLYDEDAFADQVPVVPGIYLLENGQILPMELRSVLANNSRRLILFRRLAGQLLGYTASAQIESQPATFYVRLGESQDMGSYQMVRLESDVDDNRRTIDFDSRDDNPILKPETVEDFGDPVQVGPDLYRLRVGPVPPGEYLFYLIGSADSERGIHGRGYDFTVN